MRYICLSDNNFAHFERRMHIFTSPLTRASRPPASLCTGGRTSPSPQSSSSRSWRCSTSGTSLSSMVNYTSNYTGPPWVRHTPPTMQTSSLFTSRESSTAKQMGPSIPSLARGANRFKNFSF